MAEQVGDTPEEWPVESSEDLYRSELPFALRSDRVRMPAHPGVAPFTRLVLEHPGAVVILAVDDDEQVLCLRQYRHPARRRMVELPAGLMDHDHEQPVDVARRELAEEAGLEAASWTHLTTLYSSPGITDEVIHIFLARDVAMADPAATAEFIAEHEEADMTVGWVPFRELHAAVVGGSVQDAPLVVAVLLARDRGLVGLGPSQGRPVV